MSFSVFDQNIGLDRQTPVLETGSDRPHDMRNPMCSVLCSEHTQITTNQPYLRAGQKRGLRVLWREATDVVLTTCRNTEEIRADSV